MGVVAPAAGATPPSQLPGVEKFASAPAPVQTIVPDGGSYTTTPSPSIQSAGVVFACCIAYPRGEPHREIAAQYAIACRGTYGAPSEVNTVDYLNVNEGNYAQGYINVLLGEPADEPKWLNKADRRFRRGWCAALHHLIHHGRTPEEIAASVAATEARLANLATYKDRIWIGTFPAVAKYGQERDTATLKTVSSDARRIALSLADRMDDKLFDEPLTLKVRLPDAWKSVRAAQGGKPVAAVLVRHEGRPYAFVDAIPDRGEIVLAP